MHTCVWLLITQIISRFGRHIFMLKLRWQAQNQLVEAWYGTPLQPHQQLCHWLHWSRPPWWLLWRCWPVHNGQREGDCFGTGPRPRQQPAWWTKEYIEHQDGRKRALRQVKKWIKFWYAAVQVKTLVRPNDGLRCMQDCQQAAVTEGEQKPWSITLNMGNLIKWQSFSHLIWN